MERIKIYADNGVNGFTLNASEELKRQAIAKDNGFIFAGLTANDFPKKEMFSDYLFKIDLLHKALYDSATNKSQSLKNLLTFIGCDDCKVNVASLTAKKVNSNKVDYTTEGGMRIKELMENIKGIESDKAKTDDEKTELIKACRDEIKVIKATQPVFENKAIWQLPPKAFKLQVELLVGSWYANTSVISNFVPLAERDWNGGKGAKWIEKARKHNAEMLEKGTTEKVIDIEKYHKDFNLQGLKAEVRYYWNGGNGTPDTVYGALDAIKADAEKADTKR